MIRNYLLEFSRTGSSRLRLKLTGDADGARWRSGSNFSTSFPTEDFLPWTTSLTVPSTPIARGLKSASLYKRYVPVFRPFVFQPFSLAQFNLEVWSTYKSDSGDGARALFKFLLYKGPPGPEGTVVSGIESSLLRLSIHVSMTFCLKY